VGIVRACRLAEEAFVLDFGIFALPCRVWDLPLFDPSEKEESASSRAREFAAVF
jgi:hypothetical protein